MKLWVWRRANAQCGTWRRNGYSFGYGHGGACGARCEPEKRGEHGARSETSNWQSKTARDQEAVGRLLAKELSGVTATDPVTFSAVSVLLTAVALFACYLPAHRAMRPAPLAALRYE